MSQTSSHIEHEHDSFIKLVNRVNPNMPQTSLASTHNLFINGLVMLNSWVMLDFATPRVSSYSIGNPWNFVQAINC